jgi:CRP-like cAMP-binding protein
MLNISAKEKLAQSLGSVSNFTKKDMDKIADCFKPKRVKKNQPLLNEGETCNEFYFINKGSIRTYFLDRNGYEKTRYIMLDFYIGTALTSFISRKPSIEFIEALEDSELLAISHFDFYKLNAENKSWNYFYQRILEMAYSFQNRKIESLVTLTAKQRYEQLLKENPHLIQRVSNRILASHLDIREETLSRLKSR